MFAESRNQWAEDLAKVQEELLVGDTPVPITHSEGKYGDGEEVHLVVEVPEDRTEKEGWELQGEDLCLLQNKCSSQGCLLQYQAFCFLQYLSNSRYCLTSDATGGTPGSREDLIT